MAAKAVERAGHAGSVLLLCNFLQSCGRPQSKPTKMKICKSLIGLSLYSTTHNGQLKFAMSAVAPRQTTSTFVIHVAVISSSFPSREKKWHSTCPSLLAALHCWNIKIMSLFLSSCVRASNLEQTSWQSSAYLSAMLDRQGPKHNQSLASVLVWLNQWRHCS